MPLSSIVLAVLSLAAVLALVVLAGRAARGTGLVSRAGGGGGRLAVVQTVALDTRRRLHLVRCDNKHLLLLTGGGQDVVAGWLDTPPAGDVP